MQQNWDDFDEIIANSNKKIEPRMNYNEVLMSKIEERNRPNNEKRIAAFSLITAGLMLIFIQIGELQSNIINVEYQVQTGITLLQNDIASNNFFVERDYSGKKK